MAKQSRTSSSAPAHLSGDHLGMLAGGGVMMILGWGGLYTLVTTQVPLVGQRWLFMVLLNLAVVGTVLPFVRYINIRLTPPARFIPSIGVIVRQSVWFGLFVVACAWLLMPRVLSAPIMFFLALAFLIVEVFLRSREIPLERRNSE
mgnify:CR=1 FL=1